MIDWMQNALKNLTVDEFNKVMSKVENLFHQSFKIVQVNRKETAVNVTVQLESGVRKLIVV